VPVLSELFITSSITAAIKRKLHGGTRWMFLKSFNVLYFWGHRNNRLPVKMKCICNNRKHSHQTWNDHSRCKIRMVPYYCIK